MARRNDHTKEEIKEMVILNGLNLIKNSGFSAFSTRQIAKEIGYTVGTLYNVFDNYDDIVFHINAATIDDMVKFIEKGLKLKIKNANVIKQFAKLYIDFAHKNRNCWSVLFEYNMPSKLDLSDWYNPKMEKLFSIVESLLSEFISKKSEALRHAKVICASIHGICVLSLTQKFNVAGTTSVEILTDSLIENYLRGLEK